MNILLFCDKYLPSIGGVELFIQQLSKNLIKEGHTVVIVASQNPISLPEHEIIDNIDVYRFNFALPLSLVELPWTLMDIHSVINKHNTDIINLQFVSSNGLFATIISKLTDIPLITSLHGNDVQQFPNNSIVQKHILISALKHSKIVTANSKALLEQAKEFYPDFKGVVIPSPIETDDFDFKEKYEYPRPYVFSVGRFEYKKGFDVLIKSFQYIPEGLDLLMAGRGKEFEKCQELIKTLKLENRVKLLGYQSRIDILKLYNGCEFFVLPARQSPCDRVLLEALSAGKSVIASNVDGVPEIIKSPSLV